MNYLRLYFLTMCAFICMNLSSKEIYISTKGNNLNPGTKVQPLANMEGARDHIDIQFIYYSTIQC